MTNRLHKIRAAQRRSSAAIVAVLLVILRAVRQEIGASELLLLAGVGMLARGLWLMFPPAAWVATGVVFIWYAMPERPPFVSRPPASGKES